MARLVLVVVFGVAFIGWDFLEVFEEHFGKGDLVGVCQSVGSGDVSWEAHQKWGSALFFCELIQEDGWAGDKVFILLKCWVFSGGFKFFPCV